jgi:hypothetical protein
MNKVLQNLSDINNRRKLNQNHVALNIKGKQHLLQELLGEITLKKQEIWALDTIHFRPLQ